jgi:hypothetical protein
VWFQDTIFYLTPRKAREICAIKVAEENAEQYNNAVVRLLNRMGYAPR